MNTTFLSLDIKNQVINERDILGTQLIRRNDELALLYEKLKIQQSTLKKVHGAASAEPQQDFWSKEPSKRRQSVQYGISACYISIYPTHRKTRPTSCCALIT